MHFLSAHVITQFISLLSHVRDGLQYTYYVIDTFLQWSLKWGKTPKR